MLASRGTSIVSVGGGLKRQQAQGAPGGLHVLRLQEVVTHKLSDIVRLLWGLPGLGRRARRLDAILQRGVPARALARGAQGRVPVRALNLDP